MRLAVAFHLCAFACLAGAQSTVLSKLPGLVSDARLGDAGQLFNPQVLAVGPTNTLWIAGNSEKGRNSQPWLKKVESSGRLIKDIDIAALLDAADESASAIRFTSALAFPDLLVVAAELPPQGPVVVALDQSGRIVYRTALFEDSGGSVVSLRPGANAHVLALGQKRINGEFHAALVEIDAQGAVVQERVESRERSSGFNDLVVTTTGQRILIGLMSGIGKDEAPKIWLARTSDA